MANVTLLNGQITDAVTQANVKVLGDAPAEALAMVYQMMAQSVGIGMQNAVAAQQQMNTLDTAVTTQGVNLLFSMDPAAAAQGNQEITNGNAIAQQLATLQAATSTNQQMAKTAQTTPPVPGAGRPFFG